MAKSRKRKGAKKLMQRVPETITINAKHEGQPVIIKVKGNKQRLIKHRPTKGG